MLSIILQTTSDMVMRESSVEQCIVPNIVLSGKRLNTNCCYRAERAGGIPSRDRTSFAKCFISEYV